MKRTYLVFILPLFTINLLANDLVSEPWGPDSELSRMSRIQLMQVEGQKRELSYTKQEKTHIEKCKYTISQRACRKMIHFFQNYISEIDGPRSSFYPTSSQYALDSICQFGVLKGIAMGCDRLMRENKEEWVYEHTQKYGIDRKVDFFTPS